MSRHLLIRCDRAGCPERIETSASDSNPVSLSVPGGWLTLHEEGLSDKHFCSKACIAQAYAPLASFVAEVNSAANAAPFSDPTTVNVPQPEVKPSARRTKAQ